MTTMMAMRDGNRSGSEGWGRPGLMMRSVGGNKREVFFGGAAGAVAPNGRRRGWRGRGGG